MASKYSKLRGAVPAFEEEQPYAEKVSAAKQSILGTLDGANANVERLAAFSLRREATIEALNKNIYDCKIDIRACSALLTDALIEQGAESAELASGGKVSIIDTPHPSVKAEDRPKLVEWMIEHSPEMLTLSFKGMSKNELTKLALLAKSKGYVYDLDFNSKSFYAMVGDNILRDMREGKPVSTPPAVTFFLDTQAKVKP
jgi:hypothetical protein